MANLENITHKSSEQLDKNREKLQRIYDGVPDTIGCMENIDKEDGCGAWCCQHQSPSVLEVEFANTWKWVNDNLDESETIQLIEKALRNYMSNSQNKGCIFWDSNTKLCMQHKTRPYACRIYGIMSDEEWRPRYEQLKVLNNDLREQCNLVKTANGKTFTKGTSDAYWKDLVNLEAANGIPKSRIHDQVGGSNRTYHDHIILNLYSRDILKELSKMRLHAKEEEKERFIKTVVYFLKNKGKQPEPVADQEAKAGDGSSDNQGGEV